MFTYLQHLYYADEVCFLAQKITELSSMIESEKYHHHCRLKMNYGKIKILSLSSNSVKSVKQFTYLRSQISAVGGVDEDVKSHKRAAFGMFTPM